jgi:hypothetical protein
VPVTVLPRPSPGTTHIHVRTILKLKRSACSGTHETRQRCAFRREGICVDRSAINLDTSTESRSPVKTFGRFSFRGPCRLARKMAVRETRLTRTPTHVKTYPKACGPFSPTTRATQSSALRCASRQLIRSLGHVRAQQCCAPCPRDHSPVRLASRQHAAYNSHLNSHLPILKPACTSLTIRPPTVPPSRPICFVHDFDQRPRAPRASLTLLRQNRPSRDLLRGHS